MKCFYCQKKAKQCVQSNLFIKMTAAAAHKVKLPYISLNSCFFSISRAVKTIQYTFSSNTNEIKAFLQTQTWGGI